MEKILSIIALFLILMVGGLYAYVYDVDPIPPEKVYILEMEAFNRHNDDWFRDFPSFAEWMNERAKGEQKFHEWLSELANKAGKGFAEIFDPNIDPYSGKYVDLRESFPATSPEDWWKGERD